MARMRYNVFKGGLVLYSETVVSGELEKRSVGVEWRMVSAVRRVRGIRFRE